MNRTSKRSRRRRNGTISRKTRELVKRRDAGICGVHVAGCGQQVAPRETIDHIIPRDFADPSTARFLDRLWNLQVLCRSCNSKRGQNLNALPVFKCTCHHCYESADGSLAVWHYNRGDWREHIYHRGNVPVDENLPGKRCPSGMLRFTLKAGRNRPYTGFSRGKFGHQIPRSTFFGRMASNARELARVGRWSQALQEAEQFMRSYADHGGQPALLSDLHTLRGRPSANAHSQFMGEMYVWSLLAKLFAHGDHERPLIWLIEDYELHESEGARTGLASNLLPVDKPYHASIEKEFTLRLERFIKSVSYTIEETEPPEEELQWRLLQPEQWLSGGNAHR